ncbi:MAG: hypothetical protein VYD90_07575 [Pseudomonadota bacterium]|nr:hypothetical protein [Pseudomonadota bacterium]
MVRDVDYATVGRFITTIASAESVTAILWWHQSFLAGVTLTSEKVQRTPMAEKLSKLRDLVQRDDSRLDQQLIGLESGFSRVCEARHTLVHGFFSEAGLHPSAINLRNDHQVGMRDISRLLPWADYLCKLAIQAYTDATRGIYEPEQDMPPLGPIIASPESGS